MARRSRRRPTARNVNKEIERTQNAISSIRHSLRGKQPTMLEEDVLKKAGSTTGRV